MPKPLRRVRRVLSYERSARDLGITIDELKQKIADGELLQWGIDHILWHFDSRYDEKPLPVHPSEAEENPTSVETPFPGGD